MGSRCAGVPAARRRRARRQGQGRRGRAAPARSAGARWPRLRKTRAYHYYSYVLQLKTHPVDTGVENEM